MGTKFRHWRARSAERPTDYSKLTAIIHNNRRFEPIARLEYGDHGLDQAHQTIAKAIREGKRIALYADYDVDGTMSCVSWIWFLRAIGYDNFVHYIPDRFKEGYGVNLAAVQKLAAEGAGLIITMDTGITANEEARWCREHGVEFICTDHHKIQPEKMPDSIILNPKIHPDPLYQELCGCGITFVLLRRLSAEFSPPDDLWTDLLALAGMATICDVVPLNAVNHRLAQHGVKALVNSRRKVLQALLRAASVETKMNEQDIGFRLGPRINAVGRLDHADKVISAFVDEDPDSLIQYMGQCNEQRKKIQADIVAEAMAQIETYKDDPILFLGGPWHQGVVGIAASKVAETAWKPVWLFDNRGETCKGSARSIPGFDVTDAMASASDLFAKFGGHSAAGGFSFDSEQASAIKDRLCAFAEKKRKADPGLWESSITYDCELPLGLMALPLLDQLEALRPFGHCFEEPLLEVQAPVVDVAHYKDKQTGEPRHTAVSIEAGPGRVEKVMFFNEVVTDLGIDTTTRFLVNVSRNSFRGRESLSLIGRDYQLA